MKDRKQIMKKIGIVFGIIMGIFLIINFVWFFGVKIRYMNMTKKLDKVEQTEEEKEEGINKNRYEKIKDNYSYYIKDTNYLGNTGFVTIGDVEGLVLETDKEGNVLSDNGTYVSLFIWPKMFSGYDYGVDITNKDSWHQIYVDENGNYIYDDDLDPEAQENIVKILEENREEIDRLFKLADEMWDIR